ncbi:probable F-box protein At5g47300 [Eutrema salsugineum]|uniref:probable F-box protein At5g47300 n=1 Tax=Eutrema salsugineum TaxID=72664 RepID=UPI000CED359F|nr:probable F-box protein At5g47300 [Eutrema salsugineum]
MTMISELPENLLEEILFRIPARSIKRLRSTCKRWKRLFKDKRFTISHFDKAPKQFLSFMLSESRLSLMHNNLHRFSPVKVTSELNLIDSHSGFDQIGIRQVFQCDGLLLCLTNESKTRIVVWNPCTGQTRWINHYKLDTTYALGSYQDKKSNDVSYKILACSCREIFERQSLPRKDSSYRTLSLSVFREEKLSVLSQCKVTSKIEIWVTNKFTETKTVSWSKVLPVDLDPGSEVWPGGSFLFDEEKKVLVCCDGLQYNKKATQGLAKQKILRRMSKLHS